MKYYFSLLLSFFMLLGCQPEKVSVKDLKQVVQSVPVTSADIKQIQNVSFGDSHWQIAASETMGLIGFNDHGKPQILIENASVESFDVRYQDAPLLMALDDANSRLRAFDLFFDENQLQLKERTIDLISNVAFEAMCLYQEPNSEFLYSFLLDEQGTVQQWLHYHSDQILESRFVRSIPLGGELTHCKVDDMRGRLYVVQQGHGVWSLDARAESADDRQLVDMMKPFGSLEGELGALYVDEFSHQLWLAEPETSRIKEYRLENDYPNNIGTVWSTGNIKHMAGIAVNHTMLWLAQDEADTLVGFERPLNEGELKPMAVKTYSRVYPSAETEPVGSLGDAADDPAVWVNSKKPEKSLIIATDKRSGLAVYDLSGKLKQFLPVGRVNNVDVRYDISFGDSRIDIAAATNRSHQGIDLFSIDQSNGNLRYLKNSIIESQLRDLYGLCLYQQPETGAVFVIANDKDGQFEQWRLEPGQGEIQSTRVRTFSLDSQPEGCIADDEQKMLYVGEENKAIWKLSAEPDVDAKKILVDHVDNGQLNADIEGMGLYIMANGKGYLVVSSQGDDSYSVYERHGNNPYVGSFRVVENTLLGIDGSSETDGLEVSSANFGGQYSEGIFIAQDGRNIMPMEKQNFKLVPWSRIAKGLKLEDKLSSVQ